MKKYINNNGCPVHDKKPSTVLNQKGGEEILPGTLHGGEEIKPGTLHGGEEIKPGTLHGGEEIKPGTLHESSLNKIGGDTPSDFSTKNSFDKGFKECYAIGLNKGRGDKESGRAFKKIISDGWISFLEYAGDSAIMAAKGYADGYGIDQNAMIVKRCKAEKLKEGTLHSNYSPATYRTKDGNAFYKFQYVDIGSKFEIDIVEQPSYRHRDTSAHVIHRLPSARGGEKICISSGHEPTTLESAKNISIQWAELTHEYIKTGKTIDQQVSQNAGANTSNNGTNKSGGFWDWLFG